VTPGLDLNRWTKVASQTFHKELTLWKVTHH
jgi:integrase